MSDHDPREDYDDEPWRGRAVKGRLINVPADLMWSCGWMQIAVSLYAVFSAVVTTVPALSGPPAGGVRWLPSLLFLVVGLVGLLVNGLVVRGAKAMRRGADYPRAVLAACLTVTSVPCIASFPYTVPIGIWALIVLNRPDVRAWFRANRVAADGPPPELRRFPTDR